MRLSFRAGKFILTSAREGTQQIVGPFKAVKYRRNADNKACRMLNRLFVKRYDAPEMPPLPFLDSHQIKGINWILTRSRSYLAHAPGAGKTAQAVIAACLVDDPGPAVFIVPPSLTLNWEREVRLWTKPLGRWPAIAVIGKSNAQHLGGWRADFIIVPDSMLTKPWVLENLHNLKPRLLAVDEASRFKEPSAARTLALFGGFVSGETKGRRGDFSTSKVWPSLVLRARHAVLLDGSPMPNRSMELWAPAYAMAPESINFMSQEEFGFKFCGARMNDFGKWEFKYDSNSDELRKRLQKDFMHVVGEDELEHPERLRSLVYIDAKAPAKIRNFERNFLRHHAPPSDEGKSRGHLAEWRRDCGLAKLSASCAYIRERSTHGSILVFAWHREVSEELGRKLGFPVIYGGTDPVERERHFKDFNAGKLKGLIGNVAVMSRGHNLQRADRVVFVEYSWNDETNKQCEKRASRKGRDKTKPVKSDYLISGELDERILQAVMRKEAAVKKVIG